LDRAADGYQALQADPSGKILIIPAHDRARRSGSARGCATTTENTKQALHNYADQLVARTDASQLTEFARNWPTRICTPSQPGAAAGISLHVRSLLLAEGGQVGTRRNRELRDKWAQREADY
jgi:hypothetical protein